MRHYWAPDGYDRWAAAVLKGAEPFNAFAEPLPYSEVKATAKSVAKWVWRNMTPQSWRNLVATTHTPEQQAERCRRSGQSRRQASSDACSRAHELADKGLSQRATARELGVNQACVSRWLKAG